MLVILVLIAIGLIIGSFVNALVWRIYEQETMSSGKANKGWVRRLSILHGRSMCVHCHHQLATKDLIPVFSWITLMGKCRYCNKPIHWHYPAVELATALLFVFSYIFWPEGLEGIGLITFIAWLIFAAGFMALIIYDLRWRLLPNRIVYPLIALALLQVLIECLYGNSIQIVLERLWGVAIASGIFYVLFQVSKGTWIGGGDVKLGVVLGLLIGGPLASFLMLFLASLAGTVIAYALIILKRADRKMHLPFGPLLIGATIMVQLFGDHLIEFIERYYLV